MGDFCCFTSMKAIAAVTIRMSKEFLKTLIVEGSSLSDRCNSLKHCELAVETSDSELLGAKKKKNCSAALFFSMRSQFNFTLKFLNFRHLFRLDFRNL